LRRRSGLTMIEVITALALFVIIFAMLMTVFRTVTRLWLPEQSAKQLQARGETVMDLLASDFYQAVADTGIMLDGGERTTPCFVLDCPMDVPPKPEENKDTPQVVLQMILSNAQLHPNASTLDSPQIVLCFTRHALPRTSLSTDETPDKRISLDAVFYVCYSNCLSRHVYPLVRSGWDDNPSDTVSDLLVRRGTQLINELPLDWYRGNALPQSLAGQHSLLADRCDFAILATLPPTMLSQSSPTPDSDKPLVFVWQCEAYAMPDFLDAAIILYDEADWNMRAVFQAKGGSLSQQEEMKREFLGVRSSKRITFPAKGGSRL